MQSWIPFQTQKKLTPSRTYASRELLSILEGMVELNKFLVCDQVIKMNKLRGITEMIIKLNELDNSDNLEDGRPSNALLTYHGVTTERRPKTKDLRCKTLLCLPLLGVIILKIRIT